MTPWNQNINYWEDVDELNRRKDPFSEKNRTIDGDFRFKKKRIAISGNNPQMVISQMNLTHEREKPEIKKNCVFDDLIQLKGFFYAGRFAEFIAQSSKHMKAKQWYSKAAFGYWNETQFWMERKVPFLAIHSLKDCHQCIKRSGLKFTWKNEAKDLLLVLKQHLNLSKSRRESNG